MRRQLFGLTDLKILLDAKCDGDYKDWRSFILSELNYSAGHSRVLGQWPKNLIWATKIFFFSGPKSSLVA